MKQFPLSLSRFLRSISAVLLASLFLTACSRSSDMNDLNDLPPPTQKINVFLSDAPADYQHVFIDIEKVEIKVDRDGSHASDDSYGDFDDDYDDIEDVDQFGRWITLDFNPQVMDVLALRNGMERLLGAANVPTRVRKVRFTIGSNSYVVDGDGRQSRLTMINETENFVYVRVKEADMDRSVRGSIDLRVDFDLARSVEAVGDEFVLRPKMRLFNLQTSGSVAGNIFPLAVGARVLVVDGLGFETGAIPSTEDGLFRIRGLRPGVVYTMVIDAPGYRPYEIRDVEVRAQTETSLGEINL